jgi:hypothetical protein
MEVVMSRKMIFKLIVDTIMTIIMVVLMGYNILGNKMHEILGITLFVLFLFHCILNRKWFTSLHNIPNNFKKNKVMFIWTVTNILLIANMIILAVSSVMISREVFAGLSIEYNSIWVYIHNVCAYAGLIIMSIHLGFHWNLIMGGIKKALHLQGENIIRNILLKSLALLMVISGVKSSFDRDIATKFLPTSLKNDNEVNDDIKMTTTKQNSNQTGDVNENNEIEKEKSNFKPGNHGDKNEVERTFTETIQEGETVNDFLGKLICTGCGKQCSLLSPRCGVGENQAAVATEYYNSYSQNESTDTESVTESSDQVQQNTIVVSDDDDTLLNLFMDFIPIMGLYVAGTYYTLKVINKKKMTKKEDEKKESNRN